MRLSSLTNLDSNLVSVVLSRVIVGASGVISIRLLTEFLSHQEVGKYFLINSALAFLSFGFFSPTGQMLSRFAHELRKKGKLASVLAIYVGAKQLFITILLSLFLLIFFRYFSTEGLSPGELSVILFFGVLAGNFNVVLGLVNLLGDQKLHAVWLSASTIFVILASSLAIMVSPFAQSWLITTYLTQIACFCLLTYQMKYLKDFNFAKFLDQISFTNIQTVLKFCLPLSVVLSLQWFFVSGYRFNIEAIFGLQVLAQIAVALSISSAVFVALESLLNQYFLPAYYRKISSADKEIKALAWNKLSAQLSPIYTFALWFFICCSPFFHKLLVAEEFSAYTEILLVGLAIEYLRVHTNLLLLVSQAEMKTVRTPLAYVVGLGIFFYLTQLPLFQASIFLFAVCLLLCHLTILVITFTQMRKLSRVSIHFGVILTPTIFSTPATGLAIFGGFDNSSIPFVACVSIWFLLSFYIYRKLHYPRYLEV